MTDTSIGLVPESSGPKVRVVRLNINGVDVDAQVIAFADPITGELQTITGGASHVIGRELSMSAFAGLTITASPLSIVDIPIFTVPAGCYTVELAAYKTTVGTWVAFTGAAYFKLNSAMTSVSDAATNFPVFANDRVRMAVAPGDVIHVRGDTGAVGNIAIVPLG